MNDVFKALADPTRRDILRMLAQHPASINTIAEQFDMTRPAVSKHIKILQQSNLVDIEVDASDARQRNCYLQLEALQEVEEYITALEIFWKNRLHGLGSYLQRKHQL
ncbi:MAG: helix-turn-helix transcriptional regulator [Saprospiraceae bacterium]|nr:helix-turn-helix transcriptional regulator [Saprospiraceae bacterium]